MNIRRFIRTFRITETTANEAAMRLRAKLSVRRMTPIVVAQAEARLRRQLFTGAGCAKAIDDVEAWAIQADHYPRPR